MKADFHKSNGIYIATLHYFDNEGKDHFTYSLADTSKEELIKKAKWKIEDITKLSKEQKEKIKESVKEYFKQHPELEVPKNKESGLPFWEDDFMMTHSED